MRFAEGCTDSGHGREWQQRFLAVALTVALGAVACGGNSHQTTRPKGLTYTTLEGWHNNVDLRVSQAAGAVAVKGDSNAAGKPQSEWTQAAVLETPEKGLENLQPGENVCVVFTAGGVTRVGELPPNPPALNQADPQHKDTARIAMLVGGGDTFMQFCLLKANGGVNLLPTTLEEGRATPLNEIAEEYPGTVTVATP